MWPNSPPTDRPETKTAELQAIKSISKSVRLTSDRPVETIHRYIKSSTKHGQASNMQAKAYKSHVEIQQSRTISACQCSLQIGTIANSLHQSRENTQTRGQNLWKAAGWLQTRVFSQSSISQRPPALQASQKAFYSSFNLRENPSTSSDLQQPQYGLSSIHNVPNDYNRQVSTDNPHTITLFGYC